MQKKKNVRWLDIRAKSTQLHLNQVSNIINSFQVAFVSWQKKNNDEGAAVAILYFDRLFVKRDQFHDRSLTKLKSFKCHVCGSIQTINFNQMCVYHLKNCKKFKRKRKKKIWKAGNYQITIKNSRSLKNYFL